MTGVPAVTDPFFGGGYYTYPELRRIRDAGRRHHLAMGALRERDRKARRRGRPVDLPVETAGSWLHGSPMDWSYPTTTEGS